MAARPGENAGGNGTPVGVAVGGWYVVGAGALPCCHGSPGPPSGSAPCCAAPPKGCARAVGDIMAWLELIVTR